MTQQVAMKDKADCWDVIQKRDRSHAGAFVFGVKTTGIYCRPGCPARTPNYENIEVYQLPQAAEKAGFRPCKRCHPQEFTPANPQATLIQQVCRYIDDHIEEAPTLDQLGVAFSVSPFHLQRTFKSIMGITPRQYAEWLRLGCLKGRLRAGENVTDALYSVGFGSSSRLYERSDATLGMTPATYSRGGEGMYIHYTIVDCELGLVLVGVTEKGICSVHLGRNETELVDVIHAEYPAAHIERNRNAMCDWVTAIIEHLKGRRPHLDLPVDVRASAFERLVWQELINIPYGETRTYGEIAAAIGHPKAASAVAHACYANPTAVLVPCHRAHREDGKPAAPYDEPRSKFSWQTLYDNEQTQASKQKEG